MRLIETRGTGVKLIYESCKKAGIKKPEYHEEGDFVKVIFYFEKDFEQYEDEVEGILAFMKTRPSISAQELADYLSVSRNTAIRKLNQLGEKGMVKKIGKGPAVRYMIGY